MPSSFSSGTSLQTTTMSSGPGARPYFSLNSPTGWSGALAETSTGGSIRWTRR